MGSLKEEIKKRRTFAIISHPDAGKTTLTEKFLLYGGAINLAGSVKGKKTAKHAVSDWMEIEKERGISVTSSVLQFEFNMGVTVQDDLADDLLIKGMWEAICRLILGTIFSYLHSCRIGISCRAEFVFQFRPVQDFSD